MTRHALVASLAAFATINTATAQDRSDLRWRDECHDRSEWRSTVRYCEVRVERLGAIGTNGQLAVDGGENGSVEVAGSEGDSIIVHERIETQAASEGEAEALAHEVRIISAGNSIRAEGPSSWHRRNWTVSYRITVPRHVNLQLSAVNGPLTVESVTGRLSLRAVNGPIELDDVAGDVRARAQNGPLDVRLSGPRWDGVGLDAETENGPVDLSLPAQYAAHLETSTVNGPMEIDFPITVQGLIDPRRLTMDIGGGGPPVRAVTTNGPVHVSRKG